MVTLNDLSKKVKFSTSVISRALNGRYGVKKSTREMILKAAKEMGYYPNAAARSLATNKTETIGVMMANISVSYFSAIIAGMEYVANKTNYTLLFSNSYEELEYEEVLTKIVNAQRVDGLIIIGNRVKTRAYIQKLASLGTPFVLMGGGYYPDPKINCLWIDNIGGAYTATRHLIERGHTRIAHITGSFEYQASFDRLEGYKKALSEANLPFREELVINGDFSWQSGYKAMKELLSIYPGYTAVFSGNDYMACGALKAIREAGLSVPKDIAIVGFDDVDISLLVDPQLTTIRQPRYEMGKKSMEILTSILQTKEEKEGVKFCIKPELIVRDTT